MSQSKFGSLLEWSTVCYMANKGLRVITYQVTQKVEADYNASQTTETLINYTVCCVFVLIHTQTI